MKAYTAVQKKLLVLIYVLWKKEQDFDPGYNQITSKDAEAVPPLGSALQQPAKQTNTERNKNKKIAPAKARATQDKHPAKPRRMPSFG